MTRYQVCCWWQGRIFPIACFETVAPAWPLAAVMPQLRGRIWVESETRPARMNGYAHEREHD